MKSNRYTDGRRVHRTVRMGVIHTSALPRASHAEQLALHVEQRDRLDVGFQAVSLVAAIDDERLVRFDLLQGREKARA